MKHYQGAKDTETYEADIVSVLAKLKCRHFSSSPTDCHLENFTVFSVLFQEHGVLVSFFLKWVLLSETVPSFMMYATICF